MKKSIFAILQVLVVFALATSCSKDHVEPDPTSQTEKEKLQTSISGKWIVESSSGRTTADNAFLEFLSDGTYIVYNITDTLITGTFEATSGTGILLEGFGTLSEITFAQDKISFKLNFSGRTLTIVANKSVKVATGERTMLLSRNWSITELEDGAKLLTADEDPNIRFNINVLFSASGTYLYQYSYQGKTFHFSMANWRWHSTDPDKVVFWQEGHEVDENTDFLVVRELNQEIFKITDNANNLTLVPAK